MTTGSAEWIPPTVEIRERLACVTTEGRLLKKLLKIATDRDRTEGRVSQSQGVRQCG
jgi:hypothetical protein